MRKIRGSRKRVYNGINSSQLFLPRKYSINGNYKSISLSCSYPFSHSGRFGFVISMSYNIKHCLSGKQNLGI